MEENTKLQEEVTEIKPILFSEILGEKPAATSPNVDKAKPKEKEHKYVQKKRNPVHIRIQNDERMEGVVSSKE